MDLTPKAAADGEKAAADPVYPSLMKSDVATPQEVAGEERWEPNFRELVEGLGDAVYTLDLEGRFTWGNEAGLKYLGYDQHNFDEFLGRHFLDLLTPASRQVAIDHFKRGIAGEPISPFFEVQAYHRDGRVLDFEIRASDLYHEGELVGRKGVVRDLEQTVGRLSAEDIGLDEMDVRVLGLMARGRTNREIAGEVQLSPHTIKDRVGGILRSLDAASRAEAVAIALRQGLIRPVRESSGRV
jgi:PAS domain S-box-containing protein